MSQPLPMDNFTWVLEEDLEELHEEIMKLDKDADTDFILEVDLEIPQVKHDFFNNCVPAPEQAQTLFHYAWRGSKGLIPRYIRTTGVWSQCIVIGPNPWTDKHDWKHYFSATFLYGR